MASSFSVSRLRVRLALRVLQSQYCHTCSLPGSNLHGFATITISCTMRSYGKMTLSWQFAPIFLYTIQFIPCINKCIYVYKNCNTETYFVFCKPAKCAGPEVYKFIFYCIFFSTYIYKIREIEIL